MNGVIAGGYGDEFPVVGGVGYIEFVAVVLFADGVYLCGQFHGLKVHFHDVFDGFVECDVVVGGGGIVIVFAESRVDVDGDVEDFLSYLVEFAPMPVASSAGAASAQTFGGRGCEDVVWFVNDFAPCAEVIIHGLMRGLAKRQRSGVFGLHVFGGVVFESFECAIEEARHGVEVAVGQRFVAGDVAQNIIFGALYDAYRRIRVAIK